MPLSITRSLGKTCVCDAILGIGTAQVNVRREREEGEGKSPLQARRSIFDLLTVARDL